MLPDFRLETYFSRWEFRARFNLAGSDVETLSMEELLALADAQDLDAWSQLRLGYTETYGSPALRRAIASTYRHMDVAQILCFAGAQEGIFCAMHALLTPSDHAVVLVPNYQSLEEIPLSICEVTGVALQIGDACVLDLDELQTALRPNTRLIAMNFPNTPPGRSSTARRSRACYGWLSIESSICSLTRCIVGSSTTHIACCRKRRTATRARCHSV